MASIIYNIKDLSEEQKRIIKSSVTVLQKFDQSLTASFYSHMLSNHPEVKVFFNETDQKNLKQPKALATVLLNYAKNIDNLSALQETFVQIVSKHVGLQVKPENYRILGKCLIETMIKLLGPKTATTEFVEAWSTAYGNLAQTLINAETLEYRENQWDGFRKFRVTRIRQEADNVKSIYFSPSDGECIQMPKRGQHVCIRWSLPNEDPEVSREYSLSAYPNFDEYRISVRLIPNGKVSSFVHKQLKVNDEIEVAPPSGQFVYQEGDLTDAVIVYAAGIGITPMISIIEAALTKGRIVNLFYSNKTQGTRTFYSWLSNLKVSFGKRFVVQEFLSHERQQVNFVEDGEYRRLQSLDFDCVDYNRARHVYVSGPRNYMKFVNKELELRGVTASIMSEHFGLINISTTRNSCSRLLLWKQLRCSNKEF